MRTAADPRPERAVTVSDGYVGLNINPRKPGRPAGLDHFGLEVDELEPVLERLRRYPEVQIVGRPNTRPFAGLSTHDPAGNVFDLSQRDMSNRASVYVEAEQPAARRIRHLALRTLQPARQPSHRGRRRRAARHHRAHMNERALRVDGLSVRCLEQGKGAAVLLLHGASLGSSADVWGRNLAPLAANGLRVNAP